MTTVKIDLDTDSNIRGDGRFAHSGALTAAPDKIGLLSSITLDPGLMTSFLAGASLDKTQIDYGEGNANNYDKSAIRAKRDAHQADNCKVIATVGGSVAFEALRMDSPIKNQRFVSLVGSVPTASISMGMNNCKGGVSLESYNNNLARKAYLKNLDARFNDNNIFLYTNKNSEMHAREKSSWNNNATFFESAVGDGAGTNDRGGFAPDFVGRAGGVPLPPNIPAAALGLIISDDPFFRANNDELIKQANAWLVANPNGFVVYPSQIYGSGTLSPTSGKSALVGPDLNSAYFLLGVLARYCLENKDATYFGFYAVPISTAPL
jgi:hypothetical protein